ncbi:MAG: DUF4190 domain-containing protein [Verrucomicrobiales bacterium]|jgi:hypothetical protein|nr:DUF4190 domain-containing protein [Verrucomicrobiales bacterium]
MNIEQIFIGKNGQKLGPFSVAEIKQKLANGEISKFDLAWHEGLAEWKPLGFLQEIAANGEIPPPLVAPPAIPQTSSLAIVSLVVGIVSLPMALICGFFGFIGAIAGIICGHLARAQIKNSAGQQEGAGLALAGLTVSYLALLVFVLKILVVFGFVAFAAWQGWHH